MTDEERTEYVHSTLRLLEEQNWSKIEDLADAVWFAQCGEHDKKIKHALQRAHSKLLEFANIL